MPRSGIAGSCGNSTVHFLRNFHTDLHNGCINLHSHQQCRRVPFFSILSPAFVICGLFDDSQSDWCEVVRMVVVFICISLRINDVEHLLMFLLDICMSV